jgi:hypothetical protein
MASTKPHLEWQWGTLAIHAGTLGSQEDARQLVELLQFFQGHLPERDDRPYEADVEISRKQPPGER